MFPEKSFYRTSLNKNRRSLHLIDQKNEKSKNNNVSKKEDL